jgi:hypothetical protein
MRVQYAMTLNTMLERQRSVEVIVWCFEDAAVVAMSSTVKVGWVLLLLLFKSGAQKNACCYASRNSYTFPIREFD